MDAGSPHDQRQQTTGASLAQVVIGHACRMTVTARSCKQTHVGQSYTVTSADVPCDVHWRTSPLAAQDHMSKNSDHMVENNVHMANPRQARSNCNVKIRCAVRCSLTHTSPDGTAAKSKNAQPRWTPAPSTPCDVHCHVPSTYGTAERTKVNAGLQVRREAAA